MFAHVSLHCLLGPIDAVTIIIQIHHNLIRFSYVLIGAENSVTCQGIHLGKLIALQIISHVLGTGNANFYFAINLVYATLQVLVFLTFQQDMLIFTYAGSLDNMLNSWMTFKDESCFFSWKASAILSSFIILQNLIS